MSERDEHVAYLSGLSLRLGALHGSLPKSIKKKIEEDANMKRLGWKFELDHDDLNNLRGWIKKAQDMDDEKEDDFGYFLYQLTLKLGLMNNSLNAREKALVRKAKATGWDPKLDKYELGVLLDLVETLLQED